MNVLEVKGLHVWFTLPGGREVHAVQGISFCLEPGQRMGLVGESGCGKTTALLALMGLLPPSASVAGQVLLDGIDILAAGESAIRRYRWSTVSMVFQGTMNALNPVQTVGAQIAEPLRVHDVAGGAQARVRVGELLELAALPATIAARYPHQLSGGQRQRVCLAMALACRPRVLLADEPTTALDVMVQAQILQLLSDLTAQEGLALVLVTHDLAIVSQLCETIAIMHDGAIVEKGPTADITGTPRHPYTRRLFEATLDLYGETAQPLTPEVVSGCTASTGPRAGGDTSGPPLLQVRDLAVHYPVRRRLAGVVRRRPRQSVRAVDGMSVTLHRGEMLAVVGESGCGKTTTALAILKMIKPTRGSIIIAGQDIGQMSSRRMRRLRRRAQMIYQDPYEALDPRRTVRQNVEEVLLVHRVCPSKQQRRQRVIKALEAVELRPADLYLDRYPEELSGGQRQRVAIAASLVLGPELLVADEPVSMLDVSVRAGILALLERLKRDDGMGVVMITHDLATAAHLADRIAVLYLGRVVEEGPARDVVRNPRHPYTQALLSVVPSIHRRPESTMTLLVGEAPDASSIPAGCRFHPRCPLAVPACHTDDPQLLPPPLQSTAEHKVACMVTNRAI